MAPGHHSTDNTTARFPRVSSGTLRALTYNVAGLLQGISHSSPAANIPQISPLLNSYDLVLVQEDFAYHDELSEQAHQPCRSKPIRHYTTLAGDGLNRFANSSFRDFVRVAWKQCHGYIGGRSDCFASKGFSLARHTLAAGVVIDVYNLHADAGRGDGDKKARRSEFKQLARFIDVHSKNHALIVAGDTNLKASDAEDEKIVQNFLTATHTRIAARVLQQNSESIDRFLFRGSEDITLLPISRSVAPEFVDANELPLSDHEAVHVDFLWRHLPALD